MREDDRCRPVPKREGVSCRGVQFVNGNVLGESRLGASIQHGAQLIREFFYSHTAPHAQLFGAVARSIFVSISCVFASDADALGALLYAAATSVPDDAAA